MRIVRYPVIDAMISVAAKPIRDSLELLPSEVDGRGIRLRRVGATSPRSVLGNASQLEQLFLKLCLNAPEAMDSYGEITRRVADHSDGGGSTLLVEPTRVPA